MKRFLLLVGLAFLALACCLAPRPQTPATLEDCVALCEGTQMLCGYQCTTDTTCVAQCARSSERCVAACNGR